MRAAMRGVEEVMEGQLLEETGKFVAPSLPVVKARVAVAASLVFMFGMLSIFFFRHVVLRDVSVLYPMSPTSRLNSTALQSRSAHDLLARLNHQHLNPCCHLPY